MMNYERRDFKLSFIKNETKFFVDEKKGIITCVVKSVLLTPYMVNSNVFIPTKSITAKGIARCHSEDIFNEERGKRIALAKAENNSYKEAMAYLRDKEKQLETMLDYIDEFTLKGIRQCKHNNSYIDRISDENNVDYKKVLTKIKHGYTNGKPNYE